MIFQKERKIIILHLIHRKNHNVELHVIILLTEKNYYKKIFNAKLIQISYEILLTFV